MLDNRVASRVMKVDHINERILGIPVRMMEEIITLLG